MNFNSVSSVAYHLHIQTLFMMLGETMCFGGYYFLKYVINRKNPDAVDGNAKPINPLMLYPVSLFSSLKWYLGHSRLPWWILLELLLDILVWDSWRMLGSSRCWECLQSSSVLFSPFQSWRKDWDGSNGPESWLSALDLSLKVFQQSWISLILQMTWLVLKLNEKVFSSSTCYFRA